MKTDKLKSDPVFTNSGLAVWKYQMIVTEQLVKTNYIWMTIQENWHIFKGNNPLNACLATFWKGIYS